MVYQVGHHHEALLLGLVGNFYLLCERGSTASISGRSSAVLWTLNPQQFQAALA